MLTASYGLGGSDWTELHIERLVTNSWLILIWITLASVCCNVGRSTVETNRKVEVLFYTMLSVFRNFIVFCKVPRLRPFVLLVTATCRWRWVWSIGGMILTGGTEMLGVQLLVSLCLPQISYGLYWDRTRASAVTGRRLTAWNMAWPCRLRLTRYKYPVRTAQ
jgi:hypothetical protein